MMAKVSESTAAVVVEGLFATLTNVNFDNDALLALIFAAYLLTGKERIAQQLTRLTRRMLGEGWLRRILQALSALPQSALRYPSRYYHHR